MPYLNDLAMTKEELSQYFYSTINEASERLKVCPTFLKKYCRELGISRWPSRKFIAINQLKSIVETLPNGHKNKQQWLNNLEDAYNSLMDNPNLKLKEKISKYTSNAIRSAGKNILDDNRSAQLDTQASTANYQSELAPSFITSNVQTKSSKMKVKQITFQRSVGTQKKQEAKNTDYKQHLQPSLSQSIEKTIKKPNPYKWQTNNIAFQKEVPPNLEITSEQALFSIPSTFFYNRVLIPSQYLYLMDMVPPDNMLENHLNAYIFTTQKKQLYKVSNQGLLTPVHCYEKKLLDEFIKNAEKFKNDSSTVIKISEADISKIINEPRKNQRLLF